MTEGMIGVHDHVRAIIRERIAYRAVNDGDIVELSDMLKDHDVDPQSVAESLNGYQGAPVLNMFAHRYKIQYVKGSQIRVTFLD